MNKCPNCILIMPVLCAVIGCSTRGQRDKVSFFRFPSIHQGSGRRGLEYINPLAVLRRKKWVRAIRRKDLSESKLKHQRICSRHFVSGRPADALDRANPDWVPSLNLGYTRKPGMDRYTRTTQPYHSPSILQNLGKVDRTADDIFDEHLENFNRQQQAAQRLQKEFNTYIRCVRAMQAASKSLYECINDVYESGWVGRDVLYAQSQNIEMLWQDLSHKLADQVLLPLNTYYSQFPETKKKIDKRARKLVDYDGQRHNMQNLEAGGKKREEAKVIKAREQLAQAKRTYDTLNSELHDDLPALHHSRILFFVNNLQTLFSAEQLFHAETSKVFSELEAVIDKLANDTQKQSYSTPKRISNSLKSNSFKAGSPISESSTADEALSEPLESPREPPSSAAITNSNSVESNSNESNSNENGTEDHQEVVNNDHTYANDTTTMNNSNSMSPKTSVRKSVESDGTTNGPVKLKESSDATSTAPVPTVNGNANASSTPTSPQPNKGSASESNNNNKSTDEDYDIPVGATTNNLPPGVLYKVKATYRYNREDVDELSFEVGEIIRVVRYDDPEEQEDGWLMGVKETTGEKGMFPANFTRPI